MGKLTEEEVQALIDEIEKLDAHIRSVAAGLRYEGFGKVADILEEVLEGDE